jgi:hypothetical protein
MLELYWDSVQIQYLGGLQADVLGVSGGADAPPGIKLGVVFSQPRASNTGTDDSNSSALASQAPAQVLLDLDAGTDSTPSRGSEDGSPEDVPSSAEVARQILGELSNFMAF